MPWPTLVNIALFAGYDSFPPGLLPCPKHLSAIKAIRKATGNVKVQVDRKACAKSKTWRESAIVEEMDFSLTGVTS